MNEKPTPEQELAALKDWAKRTNAILRDFEETLRIFLGDRDFVECEKCGRLCGKSVKY